MSDQPLVTCPQATTLALFDFDGTITTHDTYTQFLFYTTPKPRLVLGFALVWPMVLLYKLGWLRPSYLRPLLSRVAFWRREVATVNRDAHHFVHHCLPSMVRADMQKRIRWHQSNGDDVYVVSASLSPYLTVWCQQQGVHLVCSELEQRLGRYTGGYVNGDCSKGRKVSLLQKRVTLEHYRTVYAYGDTDEDLPMLAMADVRYFRDKRMDR